MAASRLLLVDGTQLLYRSFFGIRGLSSSTGAPTNAVFGFVRGVHQLLEVWHPSHIAVAWDSGAPAARLELLPEYKAQRPPMPDLLRQQIAPVHEFLELARIPLVTQPHQEADDILASLACQKQAEVDEVLIITSDKDMLQLVGGKIGMAAWGKEDQPLTREGVLLKTGVYPDQVVDWLALVGDTVDNIPGVAGLGPKTAAKLLAQFGTLEALWGRLDEIASDRIRLALQGARERVERNRQIVVLNRAMPDLPPLDELAARPESPDRLRAFYQRLEFHSLVRSTEQGELF